MKNNKYFLYILNIVTGERGTNRKKGMLKVMRKMTASRKLLEDSPEEDEGKF